MYRTQNTRPHEEKGKKCTIQPYKSEENKDLQKSVFSNKKKNKFHNCRVTMTTKNNINRHFTVHPLHFALVQFSCRILCFLFTNKITSGEYT